MLALNDLNSDDEEARIATTIDDFAQRPPTMEDFHGDVVQLSCLGGQAKMALGACATNYDCSYYCRDCPCW